MSKLQLLRFSSPIRNEGEEKSHCLPDSRDSLTEFFHWLDQEVSTEDSSNLRTGLPIRKRRKESPSREVRPKERMYPRVESLVPASRRQGSSEMRANQIR